ncbi:MAG: DUF411 domain-containing protein [Alphaproteobacteria bacterium]
MRNLFMILVFGFCFAATMPLFAEVPTRNLTIYKNPQCECCEAYADYLRENHFTVTVKETHSLVNMGLEAGVPEDFQGCHLGFIDGYLISGHVPVNIVNQMLDERPNIKGVTLPGMPEGAPGMNGIKTEPFVIYGISKNTLRVYAIE